jgi:hypothetical protein
LKDAPRKVSECQFVQAVKLEFFKYPRSLQKNIFTETAALQTYKENLRELLEQFEDTTGEGL